MKVVNLSNIVEAMKPFAEEGQVNLVVDSLKKRQKMMIGKTGDVFFQIQLDDVAIDLKTGRTIQISIETGQAVVLDVAAVKTDGSVKPASRPGRPCSSPISNADMMR